MHLALLLFLSAAIPDGSRSITFVNRCYIPIWFGMAGGSTGDRCESSTCPAGSSCVQTGAIKQCFWDNPKPKNGDYKLPARGGSATVQIPASDSDHIWSGAASGRVFCDDKGCMVGDCGDDGGFGCLPGRGFNQPATQAEFTLASTDFYDVEIINGVSLPISMAPSVSPDANNPYRCGVPGAYKPSHSLLTGCTWHFKGPNSDYRWVPPGGESCKGDRDCGPNGICGLSMHPGESPLMQKTCSSMLLGWWSANQICGNQPDYKNGIDCQRSVGDGLTLWNLYSCTNTGSCYQDNASATCCGCENWSAAPSAPYTKQCVAKNPAWTKSVLPKLRWLKDGCPTAYTYPYDDMSSTFICSDKKQGVNTVDYTITFCPNAG
jgi:hypothetical protein